MGEYRFSEVLLTLLRETGTSNTALADYVGVKKPTVAGWLKGRDPSFKYVIKIKEFFNVSFDELCGLEPLTSERLAEIRAHRKEISPNSRRIEYQVIKLTDEENAEFDKLVEDARKNK